MSAPIILSEIRRTSPTLWSHMRLCRLRGALAATREADRWVLHDPRGWLGIAFHRVMKAIRPGATPADAELVWNTAVAQAAATASLHPLDSRFAIPERWPSYFLLRQGALASTFKIASQPRPTSDGRLYSASHETARGPERLLEARDGRLAGRPDHFDGHTLTEYKSALPDPAWLGAAELLDSFRRRVHLYAAIIGDAVGTWPTRGRVVAASGQVLEISIDSAECDAEADAALVALDALNSGLASEAPPEGLAQPSLSACIRCPFQIICPAFWHRLGASSMQGLPEAAVEGVLQRLEPSHDGDLPISC
jgi:hypothetical protein